MSCGFQPSNETNGKEGGGMQQHLWGTGRRRPVPRPLICGWDRAQEPVDVALSKTTIDANDLTIDPLTLRTHEKCNQASYVFWRAQAVQWR
jgi:hypothetical protein